MDRRTAKGCVVSQHNYLKNYRIHTLQAPVRGGSNAPRGSQTQSLGTMKQLLTEDEGYYKETIEGTRLEAAENINKYRQETKRWRDLKVIRKNIQDGDLVLRRKGNSSNLGKLQPKWVRALHDEATRKTKFIPLIRP